MSKLLYLLYTCKMDSRSTTKILSSPCDLYTTFKEIWSHSVTLWNKPIWKSSPLSWLSNHICNYLNKIWEVKWKGWFLLFPMLRLGVLAGSTVCLFSSRNLLPSEPFLVKGHILTFVPNICSDVATDAKLIMTEDRESQTIVFKFSNFRILIHCKDFHSFLD